MAREHEPSPRPWCTLEELLLVCAVNRHGTKSWDSIASELQNRRISSSSSFTPQLCKDKFSDLKRRFVSPTGADSSSSSSSLVEQLRRIRVEELRREVQQHDVSIVSLELKVKRLVEERERSSKENTDLDDRQDFLSPDTVAGTPAGGDVSGHVDDRSFNESNSTSQKPELTTSATVKDEQNDAGEVVGGGAERKEQAITEPVEPKGEIETDPVRTDARLNVEAAHDNKKQVSDVQSSASLSKKKWFSDSSSKGGGSSSCSREEREGDEFSPAKKRASAVKPESMVRLLGIIRSHRLGSALDRRQRSQESGRYKNLIRQHIDLQRIQSRLDKGYYSDCSAKFFRDLLLLFNNMIVFHQKASPERVAAQQLRALVLKEMSQTLRKQEPPQSKTDRLSKPNNKSSSIVPCGKRKAVVVPKNATATKKGNKKEEKPKAKDEMPIRKKRSKERVVSGRRNSLRTSGSKSGETNHEYGGNELSSHDAVEMKMDNTKKENNSKARNKKQGAASFLKRMKQNEPSEVTEKDDDDDDDDGGSEDGSEDDKEKGMVVVERVTRSAGGRGTRTKRGVGRPPKRAVAAEPRGKRGRENGDNESGLGGSGRARKRGRR